MHDVVVVGAGSGHTRRDPRTFDAGADVAMLSKIHPVQGKRQRGQPKNSFASDLGMG